MDVSPFGELLTAFRTERRLSQQELAHKLDVHRNTISKWERGVCLPESKALVLEVARQLRLDTQDTRRLLEASLTALSPYWQMPYPRNPFFTGREVVLQRLHEALHHDHSALLSQSYALSGLGGIGKTQTAIEYAYRYAADYSAIFWLSVETSESLLSSFVSLADLLDLPERRGQEQNRVVTAVIRWLNSHSGWLLILDNVEDPEVVQRVLPAARSGALLFTSRRQALGLTARTLDLEQMAPEEGVRLLLQRARLLDSPAALEHLSEADRACAQKIVALLGGLPLALDQAGAYIEATQCSLSDYLRLFQAAQLRLLDKRADHAEHPLSVTRTFALAFAQLEQRSPAAAELLMVCAFLAPEAIPEDVFIKGAASLGSTFEALAADPLQFQAALEALLTYSLIQRDTASHTLMIHRLVQLVLQEQMSEPEQAKWRKRVIAALNAIFPEASHATWRQCEQVLPHALTCAAAIPDHAGDQNLAEVLQKAADYLRERAQYEQVEALYLRALYIGEQALGAEHARVAYALNGLGLLYWVQGRNAEAEPLYQRALHIREQALGAEHPLMASTLHNLANVYWMQGKHQEAALLYQRALDIGEQAWGPEHPRIVSLLNGLANLYQEQGKYAQAELLQQRALQIGEKTLGSEHPYVAYPLNNLADLYREQGKYDQVELLYKRALQIWEHTVGPEYPLVSYPLSGLAGLYREQGKYEEAEALYERALHIREQAWGPDHPHIASPLNGLANLYREQGRYEQAEALYERALHIWKQKWGSEHPKTAQTLHDLALFHQQQGNLDNAVSFAERALHIRSQSLGEDHPKTVATRMLYKQLLEEQ